MYTIQLNDSELQQLHFALTKQQESITFLMNNIGIQMTQQKEKLDGNIEAKDPI